MALNLQIYSGNGVSISKENIRVGDTVTLTYEGLLVKSGADVIVAHIGYGQLWDEKAFIPMVSANGSFKVSFIVSQLNDLHISFKDGADNWDNNSTNNYTFKVLDKVKAQKKAAATKEAKKTTAVTEAKKLEEKKKKPVETAKTKKNDVKPEKTEKVAKKK